TLRAAGPANAPAERVADDTDGVGRAGECSEAVLCGGVGDGPPEGARFDAHGAPLRVDREPAHALGLQQDVAFDGESARVVTRSLRRDAKALGSCELDNGDDVLGRLRKRDRRRLLVDREIPSLLRGDPVTVAREAEV